MEFIAISIGITLAVLLLYAAKARKDVNENGGCPRCSAHVPMLRSPRTLRQALSGGWTCEDCGTEMDRRGRLVS